MSSFELRGVDLYDAHRHRVATSRGTAIYDGNNQRVATLRGNEIFDTDERRLASVRGTFIYDNTDTIVGSLADVQKSIKGAAVGVLHAALWYCFAR